jgi:glutaredoxin-like protein NrdH
MVPEIKLYTLSACEHCQAAKEYFEAHDLAFTPVHVDRLFGQERNDAMHVLNKYSMFPSFPTIVIGEKAVVGFRPEEIEDLLRQYAQAQN